MNHPSQRLPELRWFSFLKRNVFFVVLFAALWFVSSRCGKKCHSSDWISLIYNVVFICVGKIIMFILSLLSTFLREEWGRLRQIPFLCIKVILFPPNHVWYFKNEIMYRLESVYTWQCGALAYPTREMQSRALRRSIAGCCKKFPQATLRAASR